MRGAAALVTGVEVQEAERYGRAMRVVATVPPSSLRVRRVIVGCIPRVAVGSRARGDVESTGGRCVQEFEDEKWMWLPFDMDEASTSC